ncbi:MAG: L-2-amino-thiazoline-4-carboxylic acid hydrolase [Anaerolineaceae bacterium]|nr:L-2-amino-thiazoline-4-carboxylic acid hydrolase [Anaerolineaceae bacterium]
MNNKKINKDECAEQVGLMARRTSLLHYYFSKTLLDELGEEEGMRLIKKSVWAYGEHCGNVIREKLDEMGLPNNEENFGKNPDLPNVGWDVGSSVQEDGSERLIVKYCPLADAFMQLGEDGIRLGREYCWVDQAKQHGYNPDYEFLHTKNVLDGDPYCEFLVQLRKE